MTISNVSLVIVSKLKFNIVCWVSNRLNNRQESEEEKVHQEDAKEEEVCIGFLLFYSCKML